MTLAREQITCPVCNMRVDNLLYRFHVENEKNVLSRIQAEYPHWNSGEGICSRCLDYYISELVISQKVLPAIGPQFSYKSLDDFIVLPTAIRINTHPGYTGKGITICFIDSGFYLHPDLVANQNRVKIALDLSSPGLEKPFISDSSPENWHGTMTSVVCAGDGFLSKGLYKGVAPESELVLIKVGDKNNKITDANLIGALKWVLDNHKKYSIKILNLSISADDINEEIEELIDLLISQEIAVVASVGNDENACMKAPASIEKVITVGGINDQNTLDNPLVTPYHSSYGYPKNFIQKPDIVAPAIWIAAPILPGTTESMEANALCQLINCEPEKLSELFSSFRKDGVIKIEAVVAENSLELRNYISQRIAELKIISPHYLHVDGTSFSAPIVSGIIAQMLEAESTLSISTIKQILFGTALRINSIASVRQGFGLIQPRKALLKILKRKNMDLPLQSPIVDKKNNFIRFFIVHECAEQVSVCGSFNNWTRDILLMEPTVNGGWFLDIPMLAEGTYAYKFFVDQSFWVEDVLNPFRVADGFNGFNSILTIK